MGVDDMPSIIFNLKYNHSGLFITGIRQIFVVSGLKVYVSQIKSKCLEVFQMLSSYIMSALIENSYTAQFRRGGSGQKTLRRYWIRCFPCRWVKSNSDITFNDHCSWQESLKKEQKRVRNIQNFPSTLKLRFAFSCEEHSSYLTSL